MHDFLFLWYQSIDEYLARGLAVENKRYCEYLKTIRSLYLQQKEIYYNKTHSVPNRIVSINQPYMHDFNMLSLNYLTRGKYL